MEGYSIDERTYGELTPNKWGEDELGKEVYESYYLKYEAYTHISHFVGKCMDMINEYVCHSCHKLDERESCHFLFHCHVEMFEYQC